MERLEYILEEMESKTAMSAEDAFYSRDGWKNLIGRIREAHLGEIGNAAAMREALNKVGNAAAWIAESCNDQQTAKYMNDMIAIVQTALADPARNCDVEYADRVEM